MNKLIIRTKGKTFFIDPQEIIFCKSSGAYSVIFLSNKEEIIVSINLLNLLIQLKPLIKIARIGQSYLVNPKYIKCINHATKKIEFCNNSQIPYSITLKKIESELKSS